MEKEIIRFENTTNFNGSAVTGFCRAILKPIYLRFGIFMPIIFFILAVGGYFCLEFSLIMFITMASVGVLCGVISPFLYKKSLKASLKNNKMCSSSTILEYKFSDGGFYVKTLKGSIEVASATVDYRWIEKVMANSHYLYIFISSSVCYILDVLGMTKGKTESLIDLFANHGIKLVNTKGKIVDKTTINANIELQVKNAKFEGVDTKSEDKKEGLKMDESPLDEGESGAETKVTSTELKKQKNREKQKKLIDETKLKEVESGADENAEEGKEKAENFDLGETKIERLVPNVERVDLTEEEKKRKNALDKMTN